MSRSDEDAIWDTITRWHVANWMRDFPAQEALFVHSASVRWWASVGDSGATIINGWEAFSTAMRIDIANDPDRNPLFAYRTRFEDKDFRISGDLAVVSFASIFPTDNMPGFHGPDIGYQMVVLERIEGRWLIGGLFVLDDQFGQTDVPFWQIDETGRVLRQNSAARRYLQDEPESEMTVRAGRLRMKDAETDRRLHDAIGEACRANWGGIMATRMAVPIVFDPGNDLPARIWWAGRKGTYIFVALNDPSLIQSRIENASAAYGLSPSQRRLTASIVAGVPLTDAVKHEGIRISTGRTQLQRIFAKVGVRTQPALVRAMLAVSGPG